MTHWAYLVAHLDTKQSPPVVCSIDIYSSRASMLTGLMSRFAFDVLQAQGQDFEDARRELLAILAYYDRFGAKSPYAWVKAFMKETSV